MDMFSLHPYPENSSIPPTFAHPHSTTIGIADYDKLVALLRSAFGQPAADRLRRVRHRDAHPDGRARRSTPGAEPPPSEPVDERAAGRRLRARRSGSQPASRSCGCSSSSMSPTSRGSPALQTGLFYPNDMPKRSLDTVAASAEGRGGRAGKMPVVSEQSFGQYVAYTCFKVKPAWRRLPIEEREAAKDAFAETIEEFAASLRHAEHVLDDRRPARLRLLHLEDHAALRRPRRARRGPQRDAARRLARHDVLVSRDDEGLAVHERPPRAEDHAERLRRISSSTRS